MLDQLRLIENEIKNKLESKNEFINYNGLKERLIGIQNIDDINSNFNFLIKVACEFNLLHEMHALLELNLIEDINQPLKYEFQGNAKNYASYVESDGMTLLGLAAFHGNIELVKYLIEVRLADLNASDFNGDTPLHQVVYGSISKFSHRARGESHKKVAKYILQHGGNFNIENDDGITSYDAAKRSAPMKLEDILAGEFLLKVGTTLYCDNIVWQAFEKENLKQKNTQIIFKQDRKNLLAKDFSLFCLEHAIKGYIKDKKLCYGYSSINELYAALDNISDDAWKRIRFVLDSSQPAAYSFTLGLISNQLYKITKQSAFTGITAALFTYYTTHNMIASVSSGTVSAGIAWQYLTTIACKQKTSERLGRVERISNFAEHDRFFKTSKAIVHRTLDKHPQDERNSKLTLQFN